MDRFQSLLSCPCLYSFKQCLSYILTVDSIEPTKTQIVLLPLGNKFVIANSCNSAEYLPILVGEPIASFAMLKGGVFVFRESIHFVKKKRWNPIWVIPIKRIGEFYKSFKVTAAYNLFQLYHSTFTYLQYTNAKS